MSLHVEMAPHYALLTVDTDLTIFYAEDVYEKLVDLAAQNVPYLMFDLSKAEWVDALGVGVLMYASKWNASKGKTLPVIGAGRGVRIALDRSAVASGISHANSRDEGRNLLSLFS